MKSMGILLVLAIFLFSGISFASAAVSKEDPFYSVGTDFLVIKYDDRQPLLNVLFNNTNIYIDSDNDGTYNYKYTRNAGDDFDFSTLSLPSPITVGARIHTDKQVAYWQWMYSWSPSYCQGSQCQTIIPPITKISSTYYAYPETWYIVASEDITINLDINNSGVINNSIFVPKLTRGQLTVPSNKIARIFSDKPFYLYTICTVNGPIGTDFNTPWQDIVIVIAEDDTEVEADTNNDGVYDWSQKFNKSTTNTITFGEGSRIHANKPIAVFTYKNFYNHYASPSNGVGSDLWSKTDGQYSYVSGVYDNTTYYLDKVTENDLNPEYTYSINSDETKTLPGSGKTHIWSTKPLIETFYQPPSGCSTYYYSHIYPYSVISTTQNPTQMYIGANELITMEVRVFNPFADTTIYNVSLTVSIPENFSMPSTLVTIKKFALRDDTPAGEENFTVTVVENKFTVSNADSNLFDSLGSMQYYLLTYSLTTPPSTGSYTFEPIQLSYSADTWNLPSSS